MFWSLLVLPKASRIGPRWREGGVGGVEVGIVVRCREGACLLGSAALAALAAAFRAALVAVANSSAVVSWKQDKVIMK